MNGIKTQKNFYNKFIINYNNDNIRIQKDKNY